MRVAHPQIRPCAGRPASLDTGDSVTAKSAADRKALFVGALQSQMLAGPDDDFSLGSREAEALVQPVALHRAAGVNSREYPGPLPAQTQISLGPGDETVATPEPLLLGTQSQLPGRPPIAP